MSEDSARGRTDDDGELAALRRRAFAPDADIASDPAALARLDELEARVRAHVASAHPATSDAASPVAASAGSSTSDAASPVASAAGPASVGATAADAASAGPATTDAASPVPATSGAASAGATAAGAVAGRSAPVAAAQSVGVSSLAAGAGGTAATTTVPAPVSVRRSRRWSAGVLAVTAAGAFALGGATWSSIPRADSPPGAEQTASAPSAAEPSAAPAAVPVITGDEDQRWSTSSAAGYREFLDHLRTDLLATPGLEHLDGRIVVEGLRPFGGLYGLEVWAGPTTDGEHCMIIRTSPEAVTGCVSAARVDIAPLTITVPAGSPSATDPGLEPGILISYTLRGDGTVIAAPAAGQAAEQP